MDLTTTNRGFDVAVFTDFYGSECSIQKSSLATKDCIWLGVDKHFNPENEGSCRMHLTRETVRELLPMLQRFAETGELEETSYEGHIIRVFAGMYDWCVDDHLYSGGYFDSYERALEDARWVIDRGVL